ncbi:RNA-dependent RNA polymerase [Entomophthora muscae mitovirus 4]|uniref:RNA-dependent RNA polymerase n=1 Tax=Entomophthora muscae mitovirus 4 TaxID=2557977 RepID=A0A4D6PFL3_9VIRU|nr:RNA-dependent RNA polymerase [Entomophthora muscae mitovirus 4]QCF24448.1 RNA-dependent RNA polymerase [Entomophthora muscae mitovirus 4]QCF24455.1 RNA-dependent RNA polymerase [Entomophthora muscae mitovirus 4]QCF24463.1 RNA-dependent RNA polymerase [Entomophthora muscae mitovirus 4]
MVKDNGVDHTIKRVKLAKLCVTRYLAGQPIRITGAPDVGVRRNGLPNLIGRHLRALAMSGTDNDIRLLMTLLSWNRALPGSAYYPPLSTITEKSRMKESAFAELSFLIPMVMQSMGLVGSNCPKWSKYHLTTKAGPNAVALVSSLLEARILPDKLIENIRIVGGEDLYKNINFIKFLKPEKVAERFKIKNFKDKILRIRKLSIVNAPERKSRVIAILDYWSQSALKPLHDRVFSILKGLEGDCTFRQSAPSKFVSNGPYFSLDLSAATDRFPLKVQELVVSQLTGSEKYAKAWSSILVDQEFWCPWEKCNVKYNAGQPMGAYSSWAIFALTHHIIIRVAAMKVGKSFFTNYAVLGDDVVIADESVANSYKDLIRDLGVDISDTKSHVSKDTYEFAKRWYRNGVNISGAQVNAFISSRKWFLVANEYRNLCGLWGISDYVAEPGVVKALFTALNHNKGMIPRIVKKAMMFLSLPWDRPDMPRDEQILQFIRSSAPQVLGCHQFAKTRAMNFFMTSLAEVKSRILEQGLLKVRGSALETIKSLKYIHQDSEGSDAQSILKAVPALMVTANQYSQLAEDIDDLRDPLVTTPEKLIFNEVRYLGFDSSRINVTRNAEMLMATNATLVNQYKRWLKEYFELSHKILSDELLDQHTERSFARKLFRTKVIGSVMPGFPLSGGKESSS